MRAGRTTEGRLGWGGLRLAAELGIAAGVVSAIALAAGGPASRLATWVPDHSLRLTGSVGVSREPQPPDPALLAELPPPFGADSLPPPAAVTPPSAVPRPVPLPRSSLSASPVTPPPVRLPPPPAAVPAPRRQPPAALGPGSATRAPQPQPRPAPVPTSTVTSTPAPETAHLDGPSAETLAALNRSRGLQGLGGLRADPALIRAALEHAAQIAAAGQMTHTGYVDDVNAQGVRWQGLGEVLGAYAQAPDPAAIDQLWMQSPEHRPIILDPAYDAVGVGWARGGDGWWYVAAIFMY